MHANNVVVKKSSKVPIFSKKAIYNVPAHNSDWYANVDGTTKLQCALLATVYICVKVYVGPSLPSPFIYIIIMCHKIRNEKLLKCHKNALKSKVYPLANMRLGEFSLCPETHFKGTMYIQFQWGLIGVNVG